ncbi:MAG: PH domain-containing protein [Candidatus Dormibacteria bacterium]
MDTDAIRAPSSPQVPAPPPGAAFSAPFADLAGWQVISPSLARIRQIAVGTAAAAVLLIGAVSGVVTGVSILPLITLVLVIAGWSAGALYMSRRVRSWGYLAREQDLLVRRGVMFRRLSVVPYGRMQTVEVTAGPLERAFGLATVRLHTASATSDARIPGLARLDAAALRDRLADLGESHAEGL